MFLSFFRGVGDSLRWYVGVVKIWITRTRFIAIITNMKIICISKSKTITWIIVNIIAFKNRFLIINFFLGNREYECFFIISIAITGYPRPCCKSSKNKFMLWFNNRKCRPFIIALFMELSSSVPIHWSLIY